MPTELATRIGFPQVERTMQVHKRKRYPAEPQTLSEFKEKMDSCDKDFTAHYKGSVELENGIIVGFIFFDEEICENFNFEDVSYDGTFQSVPNLFGQLFIIAGKKRSRYIPLIHALLVGKSEQIYIAMLTKIELLLPNFKPLRSISDFEKGSRNAFRTVFNVENCQGCLFHWVKIVDRVIGVVGLSNPAKNNEDFKLFFK